MMKKITNFRGGYSFLSNFARVNLFIDKMLFTSVEAAFQAMKCRTREERLEFVGLEPVEAKRLGKKILLRSDWKEKKVEIMAFLLELKFSNVYFRNRLRDTGNAELIHENHWGDHFWGVCNGVGENMLGKLIMEIRLSLAQEQ